MGLASPGSADLLCLTPPGGRADPAQQAPAVTPPSAPLAASVRPLGPQTTVGAGTGPAPSRVEGPAPTDARTPAAAALPPAVRVDLDLQFSDAELEAEFHKQLMRSQEPLDAMCSCTRLAGWPIITARAFLTRPPAAAAAVSLSFFFSSALVLAAMRLRPHFYRRWRAVLVWTAHLLQFWQTYSWFDLLFPPDRAVSVASMVATLLAGNGVVFLIIAGSMGGLLWRQRLFLMLSCLLILLCLNGHVCTTCPSLREAYTWLVPPATSVTDNVVNTTGAAAAATWAAGTVGPAAPSAVAAVTAAGRAAAAPPLPPDVANCVSLQSYMQILLGFAVPIWLAWGQERAGRRACLRQRRRRVDALASAGAEESLALVAAASFYSAAFMEHMYT